MKGVHDTTWDERQAILFLRSDVEPSGKSGDSEDNYYIGSIGLVAGESYMITDTTHIVWLPEALNPSTGTRDSTGEQYFLTDVPNTQATGASGWSSQVEDPNVALSFLKGRIAAIAGEIAAGDGSEEYELCVKDKYRWEQSILGQMALYKERGEDYYQTFTHTMMSGTPAGELVYTGGHYLKLSAETAANEPDDADLFVVLSGPDAELFEKGWPLTVLTAQPLPTGEYVFYHAERGRRQMPCDAMPELHRTRYKVVVTVTPPPNTLHEAFFDPVTLASGVGADSSNGVLNPASFSVDGTSTSITGLKWDSGSVVLSLSPYSSLSGHKLDFIDLDGSVSLSLPASSATEDTTAGTLTWSVSDQPWHDGDLLMLRIATLTVTPDPTPILTAEPTPIPTAGITVTLSPRPRIPTDYINLSIRWVDPASCDSRYFVGIYNSSGTTIYRFYGYHPAPDTTSLERELGLLWDRIADLDWLVRVSCVPASGDESLVGEAELRSGLPETP